MFKKIMMIIFAMLTAILLYYGYTVFAEDKYSINLEEELIVNGTTYEKIDNNWVTDARLDLDSIGRINNGLSDYFVATRIFKTKSDKCLALHNMFKTETYIDKETKLPEFKRDNIEYIILNNERVKKQSMSQKIEIKDEAIIDYFYDMVKETYNNPKNEYLDKLDDASFIETYSLQFKMKGIDDIYVEPSIIISSTDGDIFFYNKNSEYLDEEDENLYNVYLIEKEKAKEIFKEEVD